MYIFGSYTITINILVLLCPHVLFPPAFCFNPIKAAGKQVFCGNSIYWIKQPFMLCFNDYFSGIFWMLFPWIKPEFLKLYLFPLHVDYLVPFLNLNAVLNVTVFSSPRTAHRLTWLNTLLMSPVSVFYVSFLMSSVS